METQFNHKTPHIDGYHPEYKHLALFEVECHYSMYIVTSPAALGNVLLSEDDLNSMDSELIDREYGYLDASYLDLFEQ